MSHWWKLTVTAGIFAISIATGGGAQSRGSAGFAVAQAPGSAHSAAGSRHLGLRQAGPTRQSVAGQADRSACPHHRGFGERRARLGVATGGYGWGYGDAFPSDSGDGLLPTGNPSFAERPLYEEPVMPRQPVCFRPRQIWIGGHAPKPSHLPRIVYGGAMPCGYKG